MPYVRDSAVTIEGLYLPVVGLHLSSASVSYKGEGVLISTYFVLRRRSTIETAQTVTLQQISHDDERLVCGHVQEKHAGYTCNASMVAKALV